jgi:hypothetical protein
MKKYILLAASLLLLCFSFPGVAEDLAPQKYEYAIVKWDGPDRLFFNLPDGKFELKFLSREGVGIPRESQPEEFCLAWAANKMAKDGWTPHSFDSRRILFRRVKP